MADVTLDLAKPSDSPAVKAQKTNAALAALATALNEVRAVIATSPSIPPSNIPPVAVITMNVKDLTASLAGNTSIDADGTITSWEWQFGDGATATGRTATHTYADAGTYGVTLTVTDNKGAKNTDTKPITCTRPPVTPSPDNFTLGTSKPIGTSTSTKGNVGTGVIRTAPTGSGGTVTGNQTIPANGTLQGKTIAGDVTIGSGAKLLDCIVKGRITFTGTGALVENCDIQGNGTNYDSSRPGLQLVTCQVTTGTRNVVQYSRIHNLASTRAVNGFGYYSIDIYRNDIYNVVDGIDNNGGKGVADSNMRVRGNHLHDFISYKPDFNRDRTHNDGIQSQGGQLLVEGNHFEMTWSSLSTAPIDAQYSQLVAFMANHTQGTQKPTIKNNWFSGGALLINDLDNTDPVANWTNQVWIVQGNRFDFSRTAYGQNAGCMQIRTAAKASMSLTWSGNVNQTGATIAGPLYTS
jgi:PKD repeat protein